MSKSVLAAGFILLALLTYFVARSVLRTAIAPATTEQVEADAPEDNLLIVVVEQAILQNHTVFADLKGRTEPDRAVILRSETTGTVTNAAIREGSFVRRGEVLCGLNIESRAARVAEAEAAFVSNQLDYEAASALEEKGWTTSNRAAASKAALDRAEASLAAAKIELEKTRLRAPFSGVFETRLAEIGDFLSPGAACGEIVDLDPIIISVDATEEQMAALEKTATATVRLNDGRNLDGTLRYVARTADQQTRTFKIEIEAQNPDNAIAAGLTASVRISLGEMPAVKLSPASLVLHDDGRIGVRYVDDQDTVQFAHVRVIDDAQDGIWVTGIPNNARLMAAGQDFIREGLVVAPQAAEGL